MIKLPVKDPDTVPWMSKREIPAIKAVLSQWRRMRRDKDFTRAIHDVIPLADSIDRLADTSAWNAAWHLEHLAAIDEHLRKEAKK